MLSFDKISKFLSLNSKENTDTNKVSFTHTRNESSHLLVYNTSFFKQYAEWDILRNEKDMIILARKKDRLKENGNYIAIHLTIQKSGWDSKQLFHISIDGINQSGKDKMFVNICSNFYTFNLMNGTIKILTGESSRPSCNFQYSVACNLYKNMFKELVNIIIKELGISPVGPLSIKTPPRQLVNNTKNNIRITKESGTKLKASLLIKIPHNKQLVPNTKNNVRIANDSTKRPLIIKNSKPKTKGI